MNMFLMRKRFTFRITATSRSPLSQLRTALIKTMPVKRGSTDKNKVGKVGESRKQVRRRVAGNTGGNQEANKEQGQAQAAHVEAEHLIDFVDLLAEVGRVDKDSKAPLAQLGKPAGQHLFNRGDVADYFL